MIDFIEEELQAILELVEDAIKSEYDYLDVYPEDRDDEIDDHIKLLEDIRDKMVGKL
jgi:hypothetical protein